MKRGRGERNGEEVNEMGNRNLPISEGIYALADPSSGISVFNMNNEFNLFGKKTYFQMTSLEHFAIINDAPVEKEVVKEKKGSLLGNLLSGLVIAVALGACAIALTAAALAAPVVATAAALGMGAAIFGGASLGAVAVTVSATEADEKRGEARSWMQFMEGVVKGSLTGGMVGGSIYGLWTAAPIVGQALGLQMSMWVGSSTFTAITVPKIGVGAGYALMGLEGIRGLNEISRIGSGQNWVLEQAFGGNEEAYTTTGMLFDLLSMGYMQVGMDNIALDRNRSQKETNIKEKASWVNTEADLSEGGSGTKNPDWKGSGPEPGVLGINENSVSNEAIKNYYPKDKSIEFVFDAESDTFVVGRSQKSGGSPHQRLANSINADQGTSTTLGGTFFRGNNGEIFTTENSGHFGRNWTPELRKHFIETMKKYGIEVIHKEW